ncbi:MAG: DUF998 domain-containing protein [Candidatus Bathyarchaeota archaeon]|nr:DUF998 domain-containing protein [Candidatus Bathyarchaeum tardum]
MFKDRYFALFGIIGPTFAIVLILVTIGLSPWFSWSQNALSDLGHSVKSAVAPLFNFGLLLGGFFIILYSLTSFRKNAKKTSYFLAFTGLSLQFVATFDEVYGTLHFFVSILFFCSLGFASTSYALEKKSRLAALALIIGLVSWILYGLSFYESGIAVPETISSVATTSWVIKSAISRLSLK